MKKRKQKPVVVVPPPIPALVRPNVVRKFKVRADKKKRMLVVRLPLNAGYSVQSLIHKHQPIIVCQYLVPAGRSVGRGWPPKNDSDIPASVWLAVQRELAIWYAGQLARHGAPPSVKKERSKRKRFMKRAVAVYTAQLAKEAKKVRGRFKKKPTPAVPLKNDMPYVFIYDPRKSLGEKGMPRTTFRIHTAYCNKLERERRRAVRDRGGESWVVESKTAEGARALQLEEFNEDDMGYDETDFTIHKCEGDRL
jgi:hypothetical protein